MCEDYTNKKVYKWTILHFSHKDKWGQPVYTCRCECGDIHDVNIYALKYGKSKACRHCCSHATKHKKSHTRLYSLYYSIKDRCYNPNNRNYNNYGGRGIIMCDEWKNDFASFYYWAQNNGYSDSLTIDRIDVNGIYEPQNCRWITMQEQANNKRTNRIISYKDKNYTVSQFCKELSLNEDTIRQRINVYGYTKAEDLLKPPHHIKDTCKIYIKINGQEKSLSAWCEELNVNKETIRNRIRKYGYTPEQALTIPLKNGKNNKLLSS